VAARGTRAAADDARDRFLRWRNDQFLDGLPQTLIHQIRSNTMTLRSLSALMMFLLAGLSPLSTILTIERATRFFLAHFTWPPARFTSARSKRTTPFWSSARMFHQTPTSLNCNGATVARSRRVADGLVHAIAPTTRRIHAVGRHHVARVVHHHHGHNKIGVVGIGDGATDDGARLGKRNQRRRIVRPCHGWVRCVTC
jgi:hypothetical protein